MSDHWSDKMIGLNGDVRSPATPTFRETPGTKWLQGKSSQVTAHFKRTEVLPTCLPGRGESIDNKNKQWQIK